MNYKLFCERVPGAAADVFIANLREVEIARPSWKPGAGNARTPVPGLITARSDVDLTGELSAGRAYFLAGVDGDRFDFEFPGTAKALSKSGDTFRIAIL